MKIFGLVCAGTGHARTFTQLAWVRAQTRAKFGFEPYPGTLNLRIENPTALEEWRTRRGVALEPAPGFCAARGFRVRVNRTRAAVWLVPEVPAYPRDIVELIAPARLRDALGVRDGDRVEIEIEGAE